MLKYILGKTNTKADILSRKDQVNTKENNKDIQLLKDKLWQQKTTAKVTIIKEDKTREENEILKKIRRNATRENEVVQALERNNGLIWEEDGCCGNHQTQSPMITQASKPLKEVSSGEFTRELNKEPLLN